MSSTNKECKVLSIDATIVGALFDPSVIMVYSYGTMISLESLAPESLAALGHSSTSLTVASGVVAGSPA